MVITHKHPSLFQSFTTIVLGTIAVVASFATGMQIAGNVESVRPTEASELPLQGDMNGDGMLDTRDVTILLEVAQHYRTPTTEQLERDPNRSGELTVDDAILLLNQIASR